ncbi:Laccase-4 [Camponotus floridanus]|uniref:Laccase-4 n=2 Tax=Camponotus floridanus TaxID=104421 RepID=E1ZWT9_CAMFO|nr:Laccase-4 [Camponotus floridanus]
MIPGPSIDVCEGDKIVVDVINKMDSELTIHWHGVFQKGSQYYDGVPFVNQCPISAKSTFRYQFNADNEGTHFWHAHSGLQKLDGIFGSLTIRQSAKRDVNSYLYDFDLSRHNIFISDWMHELALSRSPGRLHGTKFQFPDSFLFNGKGRYKASDTIINTQVFRVKRGYRYRFRMVNSFCTTCSSILTIEGHNLTVIATDGISVKPIIVNSIISVSGERYDFIINTNNRIDSYWIQLRAFGECKSRAIQQLAILQYNRASDVPTTSPPTFNAPLPTGIILNPLDSKCDHPRTDAICVSNMHSAIQVDKGIFTEKPDAKFYLPFKFYNYDLQNLFAPNHFYPFIVGPKDAHVASVVNDIIFQLPSSPLLSQFRDIPPNTICNDTHKPDNCGNICSCTHVIELPYNGIIELIVIDETKVPELHHPFHLHGYAFNIMSVGVPNNETGTTVEEIKILDKKGLLLRKKFAPPFKDTMPIPNKGYAIIRFRANNPGYWLFHCHFLYHLENGMATVFHVGEPSDLPPVPKHFPKCGNFVPFISQH